MSPLTASLVFITFLQLLQLRPVSALTAAQIASDLQNKLSPASLVVLTSDTETYARNFTPRYDVAAPPTYMVGVKVSTTADVQKVVRSR